MGKGKLFLLGGLVVLAGLSMASANNITYFDTVVNTDWTEAGLGGLRDLGSGNITLSGVSGTVTKAYLFWHGPTNSTDPTANAAVTFNGSPIVGTNIGFSGDNFWSYANSQAYAANVTSMVTGNGVYPLANMMKGGGSIANINGATLMVFFDDGNPANNRDVVLYAGNDSNFNTAGFDADGWQAALNGINYSSGSAAIDFGVSDGQFFETGDDPGVNLNGTPLFAVDNQFDGTTTPSAGGGVSNGDLWDLRSYVATSFLSPGLNNFSLASVPSSAGEQDALSLVTLAFDLPAGAAPPPPNGVPEPLTMIGVAMGLSTIGMGWLRRRRQSA